jgi:hypothetical protein
MSKVRISERHPSDLFKEEEVHEIFKMLDIKFPSQIDNGAQDEGELTLLIENILLHDLDLVLEVKAAFGPLIALRTTATIEKLQADESS